jgi:hypothetical protein
MSEPITTTSPCDTPGCQNPRPRTRRHRFCSQCVRKSSDKGPKGRGPKDPAMWDRDMIEFRPFEAAGLYEQFSPEQKKIVDEVVARRTSEIDVEFSAYLDGLTPWERRRCGFATPDGPDDERTYRAFAD